MLPSTASASAPWCEEPCLPATARPEDDYPQRALQRAVAGYVARPAAVQRRDGAPGAGIGLLRVSACSGSSPTARTYALAFRAVSFAVMGAGAVHRTVSSGRCRPVLVAPVSPTRCPPVWGGAAVRWRSSRSKVTSSHRRSSATTLRINPLLVIFAPAGGRRDLRGRRPRLIALPRLAAIAPGRTVDYLQRHLVLEPWGDDACRPGPLEEPDAGGRRIPTRSSPRRLASRR